MSLRIFCLEKIFVSENVVSKNVLSLMLFCLWGCFVSGFVFKVFLSQRLCFVSDDVLSLRMFRL